MSTELHSVTVGPDEHEFSDLDEFNDFANAENWTDGLPVVPPTRERVEAMVAGSRRDPQERIAVLPPKYGEATVEVLAVNAVMAGCRPEYMRVVLTAVEALMDTKFDLRGVQATTHPCGIMVLVSGALADVIGINSKGGCFGPGFRANATIGRAIRLILLNVGGGYPQITDISTQGSPAKFSFCFAENVEASPWEPYHVAQGFPPDATTVTITAAEAPHNVNDHVSARPEGLLFTFAQTIATIGKNNAYDRDSDYFVVFGVEHAGILGRAGWSRRDVQQYLFERARIPYREWKLGGMFGMLAENKYLEAADDDLRVPMTESPNDIHVLVAGGGGRHSAWIPTFASHGRSVTKAIATSDSTPPA